ncbi:MAG TPA: crosslink repair DNA glycosylase YcaQ family protein [Anaerolineales bacterium]
MSPETISISNARNLMCGAQGLAQLPQRPALKNDILAAIRRMGLLQIDTINVVRRSPYLVLWSRLGDYPPAWLDELLAEGALFEYWSHALCFLPIEDYPFYRRFMLEGARGWKDVPVWLREHSELVEQVMDRIRQEGGLRSADFDNDHKPAGSWWSWKDEKLALECLFITGELMIERRQAFQRVYNLRSRVLPGWDDGPNASNVPAREDILRILTLRAVQALGVALASWVPGYFHLPKTGNLSRLEALAGEGLLQRVEIEGLPGPAYLDPAANSVDRVSLTTVLSPFDPLVSDRQRLKDFFGFDYRIECYTPAAKRSFGYFTLPILHRGALVGRLDPKAHRVSGLFEIKRLSLEPGVEPSDELVEGLASALQRLAAWHGTPELVIRRSEPEDLAQLLLACAATKGL